MKVSSTEGRPACRFSAHFKALMLCSVLLMGLSAGMMAQDVAGSSDHPLFQRMKNYKITGYTTWPVDSDDFWVRSIGRNVRVKGRRTAVTYGLKSTANKDSVQPEQVILFYNEASQKHGMSIVHNDLTSCATYKIGEKRGDQIWVKLDVWNAGAMYRLTLIEQAELMPAINAAEMIAMLQTEGRVALEINFESSSFTIPSDFEPLMREIVIMLSKHPDWNVSIEGHTDSSGNPGSNVKLSEDRAAAVREELIRNGIESIRLVSKGFGSAQPVETNATVEGRAKNRRVELVKI